MMPFKMHCAALLLSSCLLGIAACDKPAAEQAESADLAALGQRVAAASTVTERLQAIRAVKRLQHAYGHYSEVGLWHDFADLFSDDAVGHYPHGDLGREEIRRLFVEEVGQGAVGLADGRLYPHISLTPVVTLAADEQSAAARWRIVAMLGGYGGNASWARGVYENTYVKERGVWKVQEVTFYNQISGRYGESLRTTLDGPLDEPTVAFHYEPQQVGFPVPPVGETESLRAAEPDSFEILAARLSELEPRVAQLADEGAILNLQHAYGYYLDRKLWDDVADLFADDGTMEVGQSGVYLGKASIRRGLEQFGPAGLREGEINDHLLLQPVVSVAPDGLTAKLRGVYLGMTGRTGVGADWREGIYENEYVKDNGVWKIQTLHVYPRLVTDYDEGWAKSGKPVNGPSDAFPPDGPPTLVYQSYPKFFIPPFHFPHAVTGRPPQYPPGYTAGDLDPSGDAPRAAVPQTLAELDRRLAETEQRLETVAAYEAAENLVNALSYYLDERMWDAAAELFASDGWGEVTGAGIYAGRERLREALQAFYGGRKNGVLEFHQVAQPVIHPAADGQATRIRARLAQINASDEADDLYIAGVYEGLVSKEQGGWKIAGLDLDHTWAASHSRGWARVAEGEHAAVFAPPEGAERFPPDEPLRGPTAPPFPRIEELPFHYANPVSGREPARLAY